MNNTYDPKNSVIEINGKGYLVEDLVKVVEDYEKKKSEDLKVREHHFNQICKFLGEEFVNGILIAVNQYNIEDFATYYGQLEDGEGRKIDLSIVIHDGHHTMEEIHEEFGGSSYGE